MTVATTYEIGAALNSIATLTSLGAIEPESQFIDFTEVQKLADGSTRGNGYSSATWHFGYLYKEQYDALKAFVPNLSATVCIATLNNNMTFARYDCIMEMPAEFILRSPNGKKSYMDVTINFSQLVAAE